MAPFDQTAVEILSHLLGPDPAESTCEAIRNDDEQKLRETSLKLRDLSTISPKREAINRGKAGFLKLLLERDNTITEDLVAIACQRKDKDSLRTLLDFGWDINRPIHSAASLLCLVSDDEKLTRWLVDNGADVNARSTLDEPPLAVAITSGSIDVAHLLLSLGTDITHGNLLHCVAERENQSEGAELAEILARKGADVNAYRHDNDVARPLRGMSKLYTPLHVACSRKNIPVARVLLRYGADPHRMSLEAGRRAPPTALEIARVRNDHELLDLLSMVGNLSPLPSSTTFRASIFLVLVVFLYIVQGGLR
ncbi:ankyrin [Cucurbitaria berberidis CBS 394.84]|uniref:Ankyrin n=1 Tax=Cucurbitaria berberidis CBS 394.84 TaxID=1168544 RepID=A0A9P4L524_9PLEO|nr:ankyrin [Cucurbitaria berberidis CBS 394.84]KAF1841538.1 ankyrin [Cucurbitaria berberidis CBS 394.84]